MPERMFDPLAYIKSHGGLVRLANDQILVTFDYASRERREKCRRVVVKYEKLIRLQLDVGPGEMARTVQQLVAAGKIKIEGKRFRLVKDG